MKAQEKEIETGRSFKTKAFPVHSGNDGWGRFSESSRVSEGFDSRGASLGNIELRVLSTVTFGK